LSMEDPSTIRRAETDMGRAPYGGDSLAGQTDGPSRACGNTVPYLFSVRNMFSKNYLVLAPFHS
jgi:hypothetical protein